MSSTSISSVQISFGPIPLRIIELIRALTGSVLADRFLAV
jgi:hypothetical protein